MKRRRASRALRAAYEQALALASPPAWTPRPDDEDDEREGLDEGLDEEAPPPARPTSEPRPEPEGDDTGLRPLEPPPPSDPRRTAMDQAWRTLERLVAAAEPPDRRALTAALEAILYNPLLDDIGVHLTTETRLAVFIARNAPRSDELIDTASARFEWLATVQQRNAHPAILAVMRRRLHGPHLAALAELERVVSAPRPPSEAELYRALNAVTTKALDDHELYLHTESELCRMILEHAPRLDDVIGTIAGRLFWERRYYDPRVGEILARRQAALATASLRSAKHPKNAYWRALQKPPTWVEVLRAAVTPRRYTGIRTLLRQLGGGAAGATSILPPAAAAGWWRYYDRLKLNPFLGTVLGVVLLLGFGCQMQLERHRAADVARYYPPAALKAGVERHRYPALRRRL